MMCIEAFHLVMMSRKRLAFVPYERKLKGSGDRLKTGRPTPGGLPQNQTAREFKIAGKFFLVWSHVNLNSF